MKRASQPENANLKNKGQTATELVLLLPYLCAMFLVFVMFVVFCVRSQTALYAGFMAARVYNVSGGNEEMAGEELNRLLPHSEIAVAAEDGFLSVRSKISAPFRLGINDNWTFLTKTPVVLEPKTACAYEDNPMMDVKTEDCQ